MQKLSTAKNFKPPWFIAHRGYRARYPENTLVAFKAALDANVPMIELDVTLSKDRKLVVIHDATLERTTNGHGQVNTYTLKQLKKLDAGSWFSSNFAGEQIPELNEVLDLTDGRALLNIEIKPHVYESPPAKDCIEQQIVDLIHSRSIQDFVLISSFDLKILRRVSRINHMLALGLISREPTNRHTLEKCNRIGAISWHPNHQILTHSQVTMMQAAGMRVFAYNADTEDEIRRVVDMGVDGIISSDPRLAPV